MVKIHIRAAKSFFLTLNSSLKPFVSLYLNAISE